MVTNEDYILNCIDEFRKSKVEKNIYTDFDETSNREGYNFRMFF